MPKPLDRVMGMLGYAPAKAETGRGAIWMASEPSISMFSRNLQKGMQEAQEVAQSNRWIRAAERVISQAFGTVDWHLENEDGETIDDTSDPVAKAIRDLLERPYRSMPGEPINSTPKTRSGLWSLTSRHKGVTGSSFWYLDQTNVSEGLPLSLLYINPARMTPAGTANRLVGWVLDKDSRGGGTPLEAQYVLHFTLEEPDDGFFPAGLVETAMNSVNVTRFADRHAAGAFASGGKLPGVYSPKAEAGVLPPDVFAQLERDLRTANEHPDATRRSIILRGPIDFTPTAATPEQLDLVSVQNMSRDDVLGLWGVPLSQLGISAPAGLNSGNTKSYDEAALWQKAVGPRLRRFRETVQFQFLDVIAEKTGHRLELVIDEPVFDDDAPKYDLAVKAISLPLRNVERRALIGLDPVGDEAIDNAIWMPSGIQTFEIAQVQGGLLTVDEARANMKLGPITYDETPTPAELNDQVKAGLISIDEARAAMGRGPMVWDTTPDTDELVKQLSAGILTIDEAREVMGRQPMDWSDQLTHDEIGAIIAKVEANLMTHDEARAQMGLGPMEWSDAMSHDEVGALLAEVEAGVVTHDEARAAIGLPAMTWDEDLNAKIQQAEVLIKAGFEPDDVMRNLGLPAIRHLGLPPVTVQKPSDAEPLLDVAAKARGIADLRAASARVTPKLEKAVAAFLAEQKREIVARVKAKSDHLAKKPGDVSVWWDAEKWDKRLAEVLEPYAGQIATMTDRQVRKMLGSE